MKRHGRKMPADITYFQGLVLSVDSEMDAMSATNHCMPTASVFQNLAQETSFGKLQNIILIRVNSFWPMNL